MLLQFPRHAGALKPSPPHLDDDDDNDPAKWWWWWWCNYPSGFASNGTARAHKTPDSQDWPTGPTAMGEEPHIPTLPLQRGSHEYRRGSFQNTPEVCDRAIGKQQLPNSPSVDYTSHLHAPNLKIASETHQTRHDRARHYKVRAGTTNCAGD